MKKVKLGEICEIVTGSTPKSSNPNYWNGEYKWITPAEISDDDFIVFDTQRKITKLGIEETGLKSFPTGTVLLSSRAPIGKVAIAGCEMYCNQGFKNFICSNKINNEYLYYFFKSRKNYLNILGRGATFKEISKSIVSDIEILLPTYDIQRKQVKVLKKIDKLIYIRKEQLVEFEYLVKSRFNEMFGDLFSNEFKWDYASFNEFAKFDTKMISDFSNFIDLPHIGIDSIEKNTGKLIGYRTVGEDQISSGKYFFTKKHIIYSKIRPNLNKVALPDFVGVCSADAYPILTVEEKMNRIFLAHVLRSDYFLNFILSFSSRTNLPKVNKSQISKFMCPLPPLSLQNEFADFVAQVDKSQLAIQKSLEELETLKKSLMQEYFG